MIDNAVIAKALADTADLLELAGQNPFKIRAYRNAAETIAHWPDPIGGSTTDQLRALPGIGRDLAAHIRELVSTGSMGVQRDLLATFPLSLLELLRVQGLGHKTVARLHARLGVSTLDDLEAAARDGRLGALPGFGARKAERILRAVEGHRRRAGRCLLSEAHDLAQALVAALTAADPEARVWLAGEARRGCDTVATIALVARGDPARLIEAFTRFELVTSVQRHETAAADLTLVNGVTASLQVVPVDRVADTMLWLTGSTAHTQALAQRAATRGYTLDARGLRPASRARPPAWPTEADVYAALGLPLIPPELREGRGEIAAGEAGALPELVSLDQIRGDVHTHTTESDGKASIQDMAEAARAAGLSYLAITDHSKSLVMANGLDERRALEHAQRIRAVGERVDGLTLLAGIECDILPDGRLDLAEDCLAQLDIVVASVHSALEQEGDAMTERVLRAIASPVVDVLGHATGRLLRRRSPAPMNLERVLREAARQGVAVEINSQPNRLDLDDTNARLAHSLGTPLVLSSDAHAPSFDALRWGIVVARRAWLEPDDLLNTLPANEFIGRLRRNASRGSRHGS